MNRYLIPGRPGGCTDWAGIPEARIENALVVCSLPVQASAQLCWSEDAIHVRMTAQEEKILARFTGDHDPVCRDSCLEFFLSPDAEDDRYFNFEFNPNGAFYAGFGKPDVMRYRLQEDYLPEVLQVSPFEFSGGWGVEFTVPISFVQIFVPDFELAAGKTLRGNFYKCGDETVQPHFIAWNPVEHPTPCFHLPQYFGTLCLK